MLPNLLLFFDENQILQKKFFNNRVNKVKIIFECVTSGDAETINTRQAALFL